ncbi:hypothetical protein APSETT445_004351 [Aspergillus pseudonomiae]
MRDVMASCQFNKGSAFSEEERRVFKLHGLLPPNIQTLEEQVQRAFQQYKSRPDSLAKNTFMASMKAQNEVLYYKNKDLLDDELYLGLRQPRVRGEEYDRFVANEDFGLHNASRLLNQYRTHIPCFNDDIQGTGCVTLAALMAAFRVGNIELADVRVIIFGSGSAGTGIAKQVADTIATDTGRTKQEASAQIWCLDKPGILLKSLGDQLTVAQAPFARDDNEWPKEKGTDLLSIVKEVKPHVLIGTSTKPKAFTEDIIREMAKHVEHPIIFPLSNPTRLHEASPGDINYWTEGRALMATGSPFPPIERNGVEYEVAECNNSTCFPGIGLGAVLSRTRILSDKMLVAAARALASQSPALQDPNRPLLPDVEHVREISVHIARAVIETAIEEGYAQEKGIPNHEKDLEEWIRMQMWEPIYRPLVKAGQK